MADRPTKSVRVSFDAGSPAPSRALVPAAASSSTASAASSSGLLRPNRLNYDEVHSMVMHLHDCIGDLMSRQMLDAAHGRTPQASRHVSAMASLRRGGHAEPQRRVEGSCVVRSSGRGAREWRHSWREGAQERRCAAHLVGDRGYVREVWRDRRTGERNENRDLYGLGDSEVPNFDRDWSSRMPGPESGGHRCLVRRDRAPRLADILKQPRPS